jgi:hypothetical protein
MKPTRIPEPDPALNLRRIEEYGIEYAYLTDLEGDAGDEPAFPVIWAVPEGKQNRHGAKSSS